MGREWGGSGREWGGRGSGREWGGREGISGREWGGREGEWGQGHLTSHLINFIKFTCAWNSSLDQELRVSWNSVTNESMQPLAYSTLHGKRESHTKWYQVQDISEHTLITG